MNENPICPSCKVEMETGFLRLTIPTVLSSNRPGILVSLRRRDSWAFLVLGSKLTTGQTRRSSAIAAPSVACC